jgi:hypothetical protein
MNLVNNIPDNSSEFTITPTTEPDYSISKINAEIQTITNKGYSNNNVSDGYHTFRELYDCRMLLNAELFNRLADEGTYFNVHKSTRHNDGELCFGGGWFCVFAHLPTGDITFHYKEEYWSLFQIPDRYKINTPYDGHTTKDVIERLTKYIKGEF